MQINDVIPLLLFEEYQMLKPILEKVSGCFSLEVSEKEGDLEFDFSQKSEEEIEKITDLFNQKVGKHLVVEERKFPGAPAIFHYPLSFSSTNTGIRAHFYQMSPSTSFRFIFQKKPG